MTPLEREVRAERRAQGLPPTCSDPSVIAGIAGQLRDVPLTNKKAGSHGPASLHGGKHRGISTKQSQ